jgi:PmbA protein
MMSNDRFADALKDQAGQVLGWMKTSGFDQAQVSISQTSQCELNVAHNEPSLMRSTEQSRLGLLGILDGRRASTELSALDEASVRAAVAELFVAAQAAPQDDANQVSSGQQARRIQGPLEADPVLLADTMAELLAFRERETPRFTIEEGVSAHHRLDWQVLTSGGSDLSAQAGWLTLNAFGTAREGDRVSSFNYAGGNCHGFGGQPAQAWFGIGDMMRDVSQQVDAQALGAKFVGDVVLTPAAVSDLLGWLLGQLGDAQLISGSSLYREKVGDEIASSLLSLSSRFEAPGVLPFSADACFTPPVKVLQQGRLCTLLPSLYGSRKTGLPHVPAAGGWDVAAGGTPRSELVGKVARGAIVGRLSMGNPAANGDFSGVIKNSFRIDGGVVGPALSETMISGNMARMLKDVLAVSSERLDTGSTVLPWLRIGGLHFS